MSPHGLLVQNDKSPTKRFGQVHSGHHYSLIIEFKILQLLFLQQTSQCYLIFRGNYLPFLLRGVIIVGFIITTYIMLSVPITINVVSSNPAQGRCTL